MRIAFARDEGVELLHVLPANRGQTYWMLRVPASLPFPFNGLRVAAPGYILSAMVAEWLAALGLVVFVEKRRIRWHDSAQLVDAA